MSYCPFHAARHPTPCLLPPPRPPPPVPERIISPRQLSRTQSSDAVFLFALSEVCVCIAYLSRGSAPSRCLLLSGAAHARPEPIGSVPLPLFPIHRGSPTSRPQLSHLQPKWKFQTKWKFQMYHWKPQHQFQFHISVLINININFNIGSYQYQFQFQYQ